MCCRDFAAASSQCMLAGSKGSIAEMCRCGHLWVLAHLYSLDPFQWVLTTLIAAADVALAILKGQPTSAVNPLIAAIDKLVSERTILVVRDDDCRYKLLWLKQSQAVFNTARLTYAAAHLAILEDQDDQLF